MSNLAKTSKYGVKDDDSHAESNNLWVGNLSIDVTDRDLMDMFSPYGPVDSLTSYSSRSYAFVLFRSVEDAKTAKDALQGAPLRGCSLKIYFAKPAKPCKQLWVGGVSPSVTKEELEVEFIKFGKVDEYKFFKERNAAYFEFTNLEDASQALKSMSGKRIGGEQIRVDFYRSLPAKRDQGPGFQDHEEGRSIGVSDSSFNPHAADKNLLGPAHDRLKRQPPVTGRKGDGQPSTVLWVGYPPSLHVDEQMLHNAMILFGEIEGIKVFPERHYAFVEFRSVDEARRAKEGLQGRLFKDSRVTIMFSCSSLAPGKGSKPPQVDGNNRPGAPNNFSGSGILGPPIMPFATHTSYESLLPGSFNDSGAFYKDSNSNIAIGRRQPPSGPGLHDSPGRSPSTTRPAASRGWDGFDDSHYQRDPKRFRVDNTDMPSNGVSRFVKKIDERSTGMRYEYGADMEHDDGKGIVAGVRPVGIGHGLGPNDKDLIWRGTIAKGGTLVCHARCLAVGKGIGSDLPAVVNCYARTGLDMLTKHYAEAIGFEIVYFLPDSENDFASYTEFLRYLGSKDRAGVVKLENGTTLFLVPPSDFLTNVLNVTGPDRLYGVVLRTPVQSPDVLPRHQQQPSQHPSLPLLTQNMDGRYVPEYGFDHPLKGEVVAHVDHNRILEDSEFPSKPRLPHTSQPYMAQSALQDYTSGNSAGTSQAKLTLTPELIAALASIIPAKSSGLDSSQPVSATKPEPQDSRLLSHGWKTDNQYHEQIDRPLDSQAHRLAEYQSYQTIPNPAHHSPHLGHDSAQFQDFGSKTNNGSTINYGFASQTGVPPVSQQVSNPRYEGQILSQHPQVDYGTLIPGRDANRFYASAEFQAQHYSNNNHNNNNPVNFSRPQGMTLPSAVERASSELSKPVQPVQAILPGGGQSSSEGGDVDKNQRYQSTLQFAANLLLQIQQQQQQQQLGKQQ